jgi:hypothetical protein
MKEQNPIFVNERPFLSICISTRVLRRVLTNNPSLLCVSSSSINGAPSPPKLGQGKPIQNPNFTPLNPNLFTSSTTNVEAPLLLLGLPRQAPHPTSAPTRARRMDESAAQGAEFSRGTDSEKPQFVGSESVLLLGFFGRRVGPGGPHRGQGGRVRRRGGRAQVILGHRVHVSEARGLPHGWFLRKVFVWLIGK